MKNIAILKRKENNDVINSYYINAIKKFGGNPILINENNFLDIKKCQGVLITGGDKKIELDDYFIKYALDNKLTLLGICQGMQSMAIYETKDILFPVFNHNKNEDYRHIINLKDSNLKNILNKDLILVNTHHCETVKKSNLFKVVGYSNDNLIEAIENPNHPFQIGVQWHPERMLDSDLNSNILFKTFLTATKNDLNL